jgi:hypothetical protein
MYAFLFEASGRYLLLDVIPESVGLLLLGSSLIALAVGLRKHFNRKPTTPEKYKHLTEEAG